MADNTTVNQGKRGNVVRTDEISSVHYLVGKIAVGADGVDEGLVSSTRPLPTSGVGLTASGAADADDPIKLGGRASPGLPVPVFSSGNRVRPLMDNFGRMRVIVSAIDAGDNNFGNVDIASLPALPAGTENIGEIDIVGNVSHDSSFDFIASSNAGATTSDDPIKIGGKASGNTPPAVANADRVDAYFDTFGRQWVNVDQGLAGTRAHDAAESGDGDDQPMKLGGEGNFNYINGVATVSPYTVTNSNRTNAWYDSKGQLMCQVDNVTSAAYATDRGGSKYRPEQTINWATTGTIDRRSVSSLGTPFAPTVAPTKYLLNAAVIASSNASGEFSFVDGATSLTGAMEINADSPFVLDFNPVGWLPYSITGTVDLSGNISGERWEGMAVSSKASI